MSDQNVQLVYRSLARACAFNSSLDVGFRIDGSDALLSFVLSTWCLGFLISRHFAVHCRLEP